MKQLVVTMLSIMLFGVATLSQASEPTPPLMTLKQQYIKKYKQLLPKVAVADMFYGCTVATAPKTEVQAIDNLVKMDKNALATKLMSCLKEHSLQSDTALNYGLVGCFHSQMQHLDKATYVKKMANVNQLLTTLSKPERQKSFAQCVSQQTIHFLN